ncbi:MAG: toll/interleukin-1 receptor domain-containing protein [Phycisphaerae bacterium]|nr:toll/interleukin-1 receptor domain-containing protein [Phycisphaerae bacterium]
MKTIQSDRILPLEKANHRFLQVLVTEFLLKKLKKGCRLGVEFNDRNLAVWDDGGKRDVQKKIPNFKRKSKIYQKKLDDFLLTGKDKEKVYSFSDKKFPFRYASGGTLPIIRYGHEEYYCFFYRDIYPIGWNIANGGCDSIHELLNPSDTIERELREELIAFNPSRKEWLLLEAVKGEIIDRLEMRAVRKIISNQFPHLNFKKMSKVPLKWLDGPDKLYVSFAKDSALKTKGCFINVNAEDFGIEVDKVGYITMDPHTILIDGESPGGTVINSPVGLFEIGRFHNLIEKGESDFLPDIFFYNAKKYENGSAEINQVLTHYLHRIDQYRRSQVLKQYKKAPWPFGLCPVTRRIVQRYMATLTLKKRREFDVFISFASEDRLTARSVYKYLSQNSNKRIFFSETTLHDGNWANQINRALESAEKLILVGTSINNITKPFVEFEWSAFHLLMMTEKQKRKLIPVMIGVDPRELPLPLRLHQGHFLKRKTQLKSCLPKLNQ